ncbi:MAG: ribulose-phosphate 3-epimerase [candidate division Zixibacteria bacterium 4484_95]|nr:MAG: ribulose-phosphate 3-epimerase [candidate division Zixibacteria bacterium 4484_95]
MTSNDDVSLKVMIAPSILSADFSQLADEIDKIDKAGADLIHLDVMDGHFVPNITFGPGLVETVRKITNLPLDVHLMITNPELYIPRFVEAGADYITVHVEVCTHLHRNIYAIKNLGVKAGVSLNPHTPIFMVNEILEDIDLLLLMSVNPGFGGQKFIQRTLEKIRLAKNIIKNHNYKCAIEVDGGINDVTGPKCLKAGADILVAGDYIFRSGDYAKAIKSLKTF